MNNPYYTVNSPGRERIYALMNDLRKQIEDAEKLEGILTDAIEDYMDDTDDYMTEAEGFLNTTAANNSHISMLCMELQAGRLEILKLQKMLKDNGIEVPKEEYINRGRLDPDLYRHEEDPDDPYSNPDSLFYIQDTNQHMNNLLLEQLHEIQRFEQRVPMTTLEREHLRNYIICETGYASNNPRNWKRFLEKIRFEPVRTDLEKR